MASHLEELPYDLSRHLLAHQEALLDELRARTGTLLEAEYGAGLNEAHRRLAYWLEDFVDGDQQTLDRLLVLYRVAAAAVLIEVILWSVEIAI